MSKVSIILFLLIIGCTNQKKSNENVDSNTATQSNQLLEKVSTDKHQLNAILKDTVLNGYSVKFYELTSDAYDSLIQQAKTTEIIFSSADDLIIEHDSCIIIKFQNHNADTLFSGSDEYSEKYSIKGFWKEHNLILANLENFEAAYDFFINLEDGSRYDLTADYVLNPQLNIILSYVETHNSFFSSHLTVSNIKNGVFTTLYENPFLEQLFISDPKWISNSDCILSVFIMDDYIESIKDRKWYRMTIE